MSVVSLPRKQMDENEREARQLALATAMNMNRGFVGREGTLYSIDDAVEIVNDAKLFLAFLTSQG